MQVLKDGIKIRKIKEFEERIESNPRDQIIKELRKEVNALVNLASGMQDRERRYQEWLHYSLEYLNKEKPEGYEQKHRELEESWRKSNDEVTRLIERTSSFQVKSKPNM